METGRLRGAPRRDVGSRCRVVRNLALIEDDTRGPGGERCSQASSTMLMDHVYPCLPQGVRVGTERDDADDLFVVDRERCDGDIAPLANQAGSDSAMGESRLVHRPQQFLIPNFHSVLCRDFACRPPVLNGCHVEELRAIQSVSTTARPSGALTEQFHAKRDIRFHIPEQSRHPRHPRAGSGHDDTCAHGHDIQALLSPRKAPAQRAVMPIRHKLVEVDSRALKIRKGAAGLGRKGGSHHFSGIPSRYGHIARGRGNGL